MAMNTNLKHSRMSIAVASDERAGGGSTCRYACLIMSIFFLIPSFEGARTVVYAQAKSAVARVVQRDPRAVEILQRAIAASGLPAKPSSSFDFSANGTITYIQQEAEVSGSATVLGRGTWQFRLDAQLPDGTRTIIVSGPRSQIKDPEGRPDNVTHLRVGNLGILTFPYLGIVQVMDDPTAYIGYVGLTSIAGRPIEQVHVMRSLPHNLDDVHVRLRTVGTDYFIDEQTDLVVRVADTTHPVETSWKDYPYEIDFGDYRNTNGIVVPMQISEKLYGQSVWNLRLSSTRFNVGLSQADFLPE